MVQVIFQAREAIGSRCMNPDGMLEHKFGKLNNKCTLLVGTESPAPAKAYTQASDNALPEGLPTWIPRQCEGSSIPHLADY